ncbi:MAG: carbon monoxide dehydrogenase [Streptosporangiales bacterium]|nr:carbon monoxide dehydrogenase [Streptosporangiales bacterium]
MKVTGNAVVRAEPDRVYAALNDPAVLVRTIPGCESLEALGDDRYRVSVNAGVASIRGTYDGEVTLSEQSPPASFVLRAQGSGAPGTVDANVRVTLESDGDGGTRVAYDADAVVGGMVGGVGQRMLTSVSRRMAGEFFGNVERDLSGTAVATLATDESRVPSGTAPGIVFRAPERARSGASPVTLLAAAAAGAALALVGVGVGWRLARRSADR